jgi:replicative DNA helicase
MIKTVDRPGNAKYYDEILTDGLTYIDDRRKGRITSFRTPWKNFNEATLNGLEWGSLFTIGARPAQGKTLMVSQILREAHINNPTQDFNILEFQLEMGGRQTAARAFAAETALDYGVILSTEHKLNDFVFEHCKRYRDVALAERNKGRFRIQINDPCTSKEISDYCHYYYNDMGGKPMIVTIDHSWLIKQSAMEKEKINTLYNTVEMLMALKNKLPIIVLMITQMNRTIDDPSRKIPSSIANYPTSSDIFGGDALMQGSDALVALSRPGVTGISSYGPRKLPTSPELIYMHPLKLRNSKNDDNLFYMKADFSNQRIIEIPDPSMGGAPAGGYKFLSER